MDHSIQLCSAAVLLTVLALLLTQRKITLRTQKVFQFILIDDLVLCIVRIFFHSGISRSFADPGIAVRAADKISFVLVYILLNLSYYYFIADLFRRFSSVRNAFRVVSSVCMAGLAAVIYIPVKYIRDETGKIYSDGTAVHLCGIITLVLLSVSLIAMINHRKYSDRRKLSAYSLWLLFWMLSISLQYKYHIQAHELFASLGIIVLFIKVENPESYIETDSGVLNELSLQSYISRYYEKFSNFSMLVISCGKTEYNIGNTYNDDDSDLKRAKLVMKEVTKYADSIPDAVVFRNSDSNITMLFENREQMSSASAAVSKRLSEEWFFDTFSATVNSVVCEIPDCKSFSAEDRLLETVRLFVRESQKVTSLKVITLDEEWLEKMKKESEMASVIKEAIEHDRIEVFYQPIYSTVKKRYVSAEALVRIKDRESRLIMPGDFIPVAEKNGLIIELGKTVFSKVCVFIRKNDLRKKGINYLEINLSAVQCGKKELADQYIEIMESMGIAPSMINLEITESAALDSKDILLYNMQKLTEYGVEFSLDDFGTGYSNLNYILELPVSIVKFDRMMTNSCFESRKGRLIMEAAIGMIKAVGTKIVSEGVETREQLDALEKAGIDYIQGYYFSKPVCSDDFLGLIENNLQ